MKISRRLVMLTIMLLGSFALFNQTNANTTLEPLVIDGDTITHYLSTEPVMIPDTYTEQDTEFRGVWVATVYNLNIPTHTSETQYKAEFQSLIDEMLESNMNAMLFQVRPLNDAFWDSDYAPYSRYLDGLEGNDPGWDVMQYMIDTCHANGIEFHAWMNPYRVANSSLDKTTYLNTLDDANFAKQNPDLVISGNVSNGKNPYILNPGEPAVKQYIRNVVTELVTLYDVDGIHFDDYFYPYSGVSSDIATYNTYKEVGESIEDFRLENVNDVVRGIKEDLDLHNETFNKSVEFGISPFGLWASGIEGYSQSQPGGSNTSPNNLSSYNTQYADSKRWVEEGWVDYICPQVYFAFEHSTAPYADVVDWWASIARGTGVDVYIGHAPSGASSGNWPVDELYNQLRYNQKHPEIKGSVMYSASYLDYSHMQYVEQYAWTTTPTNIYETEEGVVDISINGTLDGNIYVTDVEVTLSTLEPGTIYYSVDNTTWVEYTTPIDISGSGAHAVYYKVVNGLDESTVQSVNIPIQYFNIDVPTISIVGDMREGSYLLGSTIELESDSTPIYVAINHGSIGEWNLYTGPITLDDTGSYFIKTKSIDDRGTESEITTLSINVVEDCFTPPVISINGTGTNNIYQSVDVSFTSDTDVLYKINDGSYQAYTGAFTLDTEGNYTISYKNDDACGTVQTTSFEIDTTVPNPATLTVTGDYDGVRYYTSETTLTLETTEANTTIRYRLHNGSTWSDWQTYTTPIELIYTANYYIDYEVIDEALNSSGVLQERIRLNIPISEDNVYVIRDGALVTYRDTNTPIELPTYTEKDAEIRAVWVATVANIDVPLFESEEQFKEFIIEMLDTIEANNFNTMFFQVRSMNDAYYASSYAPWTRYLTGNEGEDPGMDVLAFIIEEAHKRGIEFHAWLNPYRVSNGTDSIAEQLQYLHEDNWARMNPDMILQDNDGHLILNPGERQVQVYIRNVISELISLYDVDGIHFDDYFYSYSGTDDSKDDDLYNRKKEPGQTKDDWRRENINTVVREINELIEAYNTENNKTIEFGISPFGIWASGGEDGSNTSIYAMQSYYSQYADSKKWVEEGWVDYILPQLYWEFDHGSAPFADLVDWWAALCAENDVDLIIGHGFYRYDDDSWEDESELLEQLRYISQYESIKGSSFFSYRTLNSQDTEVLKALERLNNYYWTEYVTFTWESTVEKTIVRCEDGYHEENGACVVDVPVCEVGYHLENNTCVADELVCPIGTHEENGTCVDDPDPLVCEDGYHEENNECVKDEDTTTCPDGYEAVPGGCKEIETGCGSSLQIGQTYIVILLLGSILFFLRRKAHVKG